MAIEPSMSFVWGLARDLFGLCSKIFGTEKHRKRIEHRLRWKALFEEHSADLNDMDVIIRHINRSDMYPETDGHKKGISSWFKAEYWGLYHRGVEVVIGSESLCMEDGKNNWTACHNEEHNRFNALVIGRIPFDVITEVDWNGDEHYSVPHIYCEFPRHQSKQPYEQIVFYRTRDGRTTDWLEDLGDYKTIIKKSKKVRNHT